MGRARGEPKEQSEFCTMAVQSAARARVLINIEYKLVMGHGKQITNIQGGRKQRQLRDLGKTVFFSFF